MNNGDRAFARSPFSAAFTNRPDVAHSQLGDTMKYYHESSRRGLYFEGWYLKHQTRDGRMLALIPAVHTDGEGRRTASLQVLTDTGAWWLEYPGATFRASAEKFQVCVENSLFNRRGVWVRAEGEGISLRGTVLYGAFTPLRSDIMGPFRLLGNMECAHGVISMGHTLSGTLTLNGEVFDFSGGRGYIETDRGRSFPKAYLWTQCGWEETDGVMLAIAAIPLAVGTFTGCICALRHQGREYRLATYRGARIVAWSEKGAVVRQGKYRLEVELPDKRGRGLRAPVEGRMRRTIRECPGAPVRVRFWEGKTLLLDRTDPWASFEYVPED